jgi:hypothetical protein
MFTEHALLQMQERDVNKADVLRAVNTPDQTLESRERTVFHKLIDHRGEEYLLRVFCEQTSDTYFVITVYATSKISK